MTEENIGFGGMEPHPDAREIMQLNALLNKLKSVTNDINQIKNLWGDDWDDGNEEAYPEQGIQDPIKRIQFSTKLLIIKGILENIILTISIYKTELTELARNQHMAKLTTKSRNKLPKSSFGEPGSRKYPMPDKAHAKNAKARASQMVNKGKLSESEKSKIDAKANKVLGKAKSKHEKPKSRAKSSRGLSL